MPTRSSPSRDPYDNDQNGARHSFDRLTPPAFQGRSDNEELEIDLSDETEELLRLLDRTFSSKTSGPRTPNLDTYEGEDARDTEDEATEILSKLDGLLTEIKTSGGISTERHRRPGVSEDARYGEQDYREDRSYHPIPRDLYGQPRPGSEKNKLALLGAGVMMTLFVLTHMDGSKIQKPTPDGKDADMEKVLPDQKQKDTNPPTAKPQGKKPEEKPEKPKAPDTAGFAKLLSFISKGEGGYNSMNQGTRGGRIVGSTHNASTILGRNLTDMTIGEIMAEQERGRLFAAGRYQIIPDTMKIALRTSGLRTSDKFSPKNQDKLAIALIMHKRPKIYEFLKGGNVTVEEAMIHLSMEWASIPDPRTGQPYEDYASHGNRALHSVDEVRQAMLSARKSLAQ